MSAAAADWRDGPVKTFDTETVIATPNGYMILDDGDIVSVHDYYHWSFNRFWHLQAHFDRVTRETRHRKKIRLAYSNAQI